MPSSRPSLAQVSRRRESARHWRRRWRWRLRSLCIHERCLTSNDL